MAKPAVRRKRKMPFNPQKLHKRIRRPLLAQPVRPAHLPIRPAQVRRRRTRKCPHCSTSAQSHSGFIFLFRFARPQRRDVIAHTRFLVRNPRHLSVTRRRLWRVVRARRDNKREKAPRPVRGAFFILRRGERQPAFVSRVQRTSPAPASSETVAFSPPPLRTSRSASARGRWRAAGRSMAVVRTDR